jgi:hypothetical protein
MSEVGLLDDKPSFLLPISSERRLVDGDGEKAKTKVNQK